MTKMLKILLCMLCLSVASSFGQVDYKMITGSQKDYLDTLSREISASNLKEAAGLLEKEIEPDKYLVGSGDEFSISIITARPKHFDLKISPDGSLLIPSVGKIVLKGKTLSEAIIAIENLIKKVLTPNEVNIVLKDIRKFKVTVSGSVVRTGMYPASAVDRVSEVIDRAGGLVPDASMRKIYILRNDNKSHIKVDLLKYYLLGDESSNPFVLGGDKIIIPPNNDKSVIGLYGDVVSPGFFEYADGDSLSTLIRFGLGINESAFWDSVEFVSTYENFIEKKFINLDFLKNADINTANFSIDFPLKSGDRVFVRKTPNWKKLEYVVVKGEVNLPGYYAVDEKKDRVADIIKRAGGFTDDAAIDFVEYVRQNELDKPDEEMDRLSRILPSEMSESESRYYQSRKSEKRGVVSIDFKKVMNNPSINENFFVRHRDSIVVPSIKNFVNVQGRVANPGLIIFRPGADYLDYIDMAGGFGYRADESETILNKYRGGLFRAKKRNYVIEPGDVILVPPEREVTFMEAFSTGLTIVTQLMTIAGVVIAISNIK